ncbi:LCP family protein [Effusibacillus lacus]|uniref:Cell envelope-related transcriptional attenuator domain-containing protein n=1 Tax=Effusibacillus lacus TaxID=1348429 RepID=A0A292YFK4_9BACL|nr:LCP family protein [Effusibacillus lacus]TCS69774.1 LytR family transcriptional attenuator [Effusibacillus lacus]GAX88857.1 hypothetical protein EFBL_0471 [Effusibacillus lacus]
MRFHNFLLLATMAGLLVTGSVAGSKGLNPIDGESGTGKNPAIEGEPGTGYGVDRPIENRPLVPRSQTRLRPKSFLILGIDTRTGESSRSDSILLAVLNPERPTVNVIPIPRDTYVHVPGHGPTKINHAFAYGGTPLVKRTVEEWLQTPIDHTVVVDFKGFEQLVDLLGGVRVNVEKKMDYDDPSDGTHIHLRAGDQVLNGKQALDYSRFRHDPEADTGRIRRQQQIVRALIHQGLTLDAVPKLFPILNILGDHVKTSISPTELLLWVRSFYGFDPGSIHTETVKGVNQVARSDGLWYFFVEKDEQERLQQLLNNWRES